MDKESLERALSLYDKVLKRREIKGNSRKTIRSVIRRNVILPLLEGKEPNLSNNRFKSYLVEFLKVIEDKGDTERELIKIGEELRKLLSL